MAEYTQSDYDKIADQLFGMIRKSPHNVFFHPKIHLTYESLRRLFDKPNTFKLDLSSEQKDELIKTIQQRWKSAQN